MGGGRLDVKQAREEVLLFVQNSNTVGICSREIFLDLVRWIRYTGILTPSQIFPETFQGEEGPGGKM